MTRRAPAFLRARRSSTALAFMAIAAVGASPFAPLVPLAPLAAQSPRPGVEVTLPNASRLTLEGPLVRSRNMLADSRTRELLQSGFAARLHYRVELWADGFFDELQRTAEWHVVIEPNAVSDSYDVHQHVGELELSLGSFTSLDDAEAATSRPVRVPISAPRQDRRYYYRVTLEVETLSISDLDEVNRWLRGELEPAVRGRGNPGTAFTRGLRSLTARLLGGERREYVTRSASFRPPR